jgi:hypothetical protein
VIQNIKALCKSTDEEAEKLIAYYQASADRIDYQQYKKMVCSITGSGTINPPTEL